MAHLRLPGPVSSVCLVPGVTLIAAATALLGCSSSDGNPGDGHGHVGSGGDGMVGSGGGSSNGNGDPGNGQPGTGGALDGSGGGSNASGGAGGQEGTADGTFRVQGRFLYDRCGEKVVLRGVNEMVVWSPGKDGVPEFEEMAKTGANSVRIVWNDEGSAAELDVAIGNALAHDMIPMVEHHGATGDLSLLPDTVDYWTSADVLAVLKKYEADLLLNIANEAGDNTVTAEQFEAAYRPEITRLRDTGLVLPLVIDAPTWGQNIDVLQATGPSLQDHDPEHNLLFSVHTWWDDATGARVVSELQESVDMGLPLIVGEFAQHSVWQCSANPFAYRVLLEEAQKHEIGWYAWSWGGVQNQDCADDEPFDMTVNGIYGDWKEPWGEHVAVSDPNSIQNTSIRPASITTGSCQ